MTLLSKVSRTWMLVDQKYNKMKAFLSSKNSSWTTGNKLAISDSVAELRGGSLLSTNVLSMLDSMILLSGDNTRPNATRSISKIPHIRYHILSLLDPWPRLLYRAIFSLFDRVKTMIWAVLKRNRFLILFIVIVCPLMYHFIVRREGK